MARKPPQEDLDELLFAVGLTAAEAAKAAGLTRAAVWELRKGMRPKPHPKTVIGLATACGVSRKRVEDAVAESVRRAKSK